MSAILPLERLARDFFLTAFEMEAILLCGAPELHPTYEPVYHFVLDDLNRKFHCVELLVSLTAASMEERISRRHALSIFGQLRRCGILQPFGDFPTELRQELRLSPGVFDYLTRPSASTPSQCTLLFRLTPPWDISLPASVDSDRPPPSLSPL